MKTVLSTLKVGFDVDSILADTDAHALSWLQERGHVGKEKTPIDITDWSFEKCLGVPTEATVEMFTNPAFFSTLPPIHEGIHLLRRLRVEGAEIHILTDCSCRAERSEWLRRHGISWDRLEFIKGDQKHIYAEQHWLDFFLEDNPKTAYRLASDGVTRLALLRDRPYNQGVRHSQLRRFYTWSEAHEFFRI